MLFSALRSKTLIFTNSKIEGGSFLPYNKKSVCIGIIKVVAFLLIFLILFQSATDLFRQKYMYYAIKPIYDLPKNSVDVLFLGSSHMYASISPMDLWRDYGFTSFNASVGLLSIPMTYFELRELLKVQKPKIVVLETYFIFLADMLYENREVNAHYVFDNIPFSLGIHEAIQTLIPEDQDKIQYYTNFFSFHNQWKSLSKNDFNPWLIATRWNRGASTHFYNPHEVREAPVIVLQDEITLPPEIPLEYLYKIIELCRKEEVQLVFMIEPFPASEIMQKRFNYVGVVAKDEDIPYLNFFHLLDEIGFDFTRDMADSNHVNYFGNQKLTSYLGEYLQTNYNLPDHRDDPAIADLWNKDYETFARELNNTMMKTAGTTDEYFDYLGNQDYILAWNAYSEVPLSETALSELMKGAGIKQPMVRKKQYYNAVTQGGKILYRKASDERPDGSYMTSDTLFSFGDGITGSTNPIGVHVGRKEYSIGNTGVNLAVYDPVSRTVVDNVNIDLETGEIKRK